MHPLLAASLTTSLSRERAERAAARDAARRARRTRGDGGAGARDAVARVSARRRAGVLRPHLP